jgi:nucleoside-diphosphate-sugar epimerase
MRIAVFGAGGFVGGWVCEELSQHKAFELVACVRQWSSAVRLARRGIELQQIDLENVAALPALLAGVEVVVNAAMLPPLREADIVAALYSASADAGSRRFIQLSSAAVYGNRVGSVDEAMDPAPVNDYSRGKVATEAQLARLAAGSRTQVTILRPSIIYGPFSSAWTVRYVERIVKGRWRGLGRLGEGTCNLVHGHDLARAVVAAATADIPAGAHILNINGPEAVTWNDYIERLGNALGLADRTTPSAARFRGMAIAAEIMRNAGQLALLRSAYQRSVGTARATMRTAQATTKLYPSLIELNLLKREVHYSAARAGRLLGVTPSIPLEVGIRQSVDWCRIHGVV